MSAGRRGRARADYPHGDLVQMASFSQMDKKKLKGKMLKYTRAANDTHRKEGLYLYIGAVPSKVQLLYP